MRQIDGHVLAVVEFLALFQRIAVQGQVEAWDPFSIGRCPSLVCWCFSLGPFDAAETCEFAALVNVPSRRRTDAVGLWKRLHVITRDIEGPFLDRTAWLRYSRRTQDESLVKNIKRRRNRLCAEYWTLKMSLMQTEARRIRLSLLGLLPSRYRE